MALLVSCPSRAVLVRPCKRIVNQEDDTQGVHATLIQYTMNAHTTRNHKLFDSNKKCQHPCVPTTTDRR